MALPMIWLVEEMLDLFVWRLNRILDEEGVTLLQWAFMQRAAGRRGGVPFSAILKATGESKDNVRRAADSLEKLGVGTVTPDPRDRRARIFRLTRRGTRRAVHIRESFERDLLNLVGAREVLSKRVRNFERHLRNASGYLASGDLANTHLRAQRSENRASIPDDSPHFVPLDSGRSVFIPEDHEPPF
jgi:DNA-binding MarR family transcriptional regulator